MKILHVNKFLYRRGGAEAYMEDAAALVEEAGHEVAFFGMTHPSNTHLDLAEHYPSHVELEPMPRSVPRRARAVARMFWSTSARRGIQEVLSTFEPDVVHFHNIYHQLSPSVLGPVARRGIGSVMTLHDYKLTCPSYLFLDKGQVCEACIGGDFSQAVRRRCKDGSVFKSALLASELGLHTRLGVYGQLDLLICPSKFIRAKMRTAGVFPDRLRLLPNFVDLPANWSPTPDGPILYVGRLSHEKGADVLAAAAGLLPRDRDTLVVGEGPMREEVVDQLARAGEHRVRLLGRLPKADVLDLLQSASVLVLPSRCYENQPLTVLEAFAAGVPVVGSALGGVAELVQDGTNGALVPPDDPQALAAGVRRVLEGPYAMSSAAARAAAESRHSPAAHLEGLVDLYQEARTKAVAAS